MKNVRFPVELIRQSRFFQRGDFFHFLFLFFNSGTYQLRIAVVFFSVINFFFRFLRSISCLFTPEYIKVIAGLLWFPLPWPLTTHAPQLSDYKKKEEKKRLIVNGDEDNHELTSIQHRPNDFFFYCSIFHSHCKFSKMFASPPPSNKREMRKP